VNGTEREVRGTVQRNAGGYRVEVWTLDGPEQSILSPLTLMPVAAVSYLVRRRRGGGPMWVPPWLPTTTAPLMRLPFPSWSRVFVSFSRYPAAR